ncbi:MAG: hypothetical protein QW303_00325 [Nitrososphaerota archaeon]
MNDQKIGAFCIAILIILLIFLLIPASPPVIIVRRENFSHDKLESQGGSESTSEMQKYYVDRMVCHPGCCGNQWHVPFEVLSAEQMKTMETIEKEAGPYMRSNYTCANGLHGVGCPCLTREAYLKLASRGQGTGNPEWIEPSLYINKE